MSEILDVDLDSPGPALVDGVLRSLATGFVYAAHGISEGLLDEAYGVLDTFFALPQPRKDAHSVAGSHGQVGYTGLLVETAAGSDSPDWKEHLNWGPTLPEGHPLRRRFPHRYIAPVFPDADVPGAGRTLTAFGEALLDLQRRFLRVVAEAVGCDVGFFDRMLGDGPTLTRAIRYPPMSDAPGGADRSHVWAAAHRDINLVTALPRATGPGLQIEVDDVWADASPPDGRAILNTGLMLERLTNGMIPAGLHRVVAPAGSNDARLSVVQFCHPDPSTTLVPIPSCVGADRPLRYPAIEAGAWLDQVLWEINLVEDARRVDGSG